VTFVFAVFLFSIVSLEHIS